MIPYYERNDNQLRAFFCEGLCFPAHLHDAIELVFVERGSLKLEIQGKATRLEEGDMACIFPEVIHGYEDPEETGQNRILLVICGPAMLEETAVRFRSQCPRNPVLRRGGYPAGIREAMRELEKEEHGERQFLVQKGLLLFLLGKLLSCLELEQLELPPSVQLVHSLLTFMEEHFRENISLSDVAEQLCVSKYHLSRIFSNRLQISFNDYLNRLRVEYAMSLIRKSDRSFLDIALDAGFESPRTFNRAFRKLYGMTPGRYAGLVKGKSGSQSG